MSGRYTFGLTAKATLLKSMVLRPLFRNYTWLFCLVGVPYPIYQAQAHMFHWHRLHAVLNMRLSEPSTILRKSPLILAHFG
jgi:hypothetical protein